MKEIKGKNQGEHLQLTIKDVRRILDKITGILKKEKEFKKDKIKVRNVSNDLNIEPELIHELQNCTGTDELTKIDQGAMSKLEKIACHIKYISLTRTFSKKDIDFIARACKQEIDYLSNMQCGRNKDIKQDLNEMEHIMVSVIKDMRAIIEKNEDNKDAVTTLLLDRIFQLKSNIETNSNNNMGYVFSMLDNDINENYRKSIRNRKGAAVTAAITASAMALTGTAYGIYDIVEDHKADVVSETLKLLDREGKREQYIDNHGRIDEVAEEILKQEMLKKIFENEINARLGENTKIKVTNVEYGKDTTGYRWQTTTDGYSISYKDENGEEYSYGDWYESTLDQHDGDVSTVGDKKAVKARRTLEGTSLSDLNKSMNETGGFNEEYDKLFRNVVNEIANKVLVDKIDSKTPEVDVDADDDFDR